MPGLKYFNKNMFDNSVSTYYDFASETAGSLDGADLMVYLGLFSDYVLHGGGRAALASVCDSSRQSEYVEITFDKH